MNFHEEGYGTEASSSLPHQEKIETTQQNAIDLVINFNEANEFLNLLTKGESVTFQTFSDQKKTPNNMLIQILHGTLQDKFSCLASLNKAGAGIFFTVNATDSQGRKTTNIIKIRAVFVDLDGSPLDPIHAAILEPHIIIESSPGRYHAYWLVNDIQLNEFTSIQKALARLFNGDPAVNDLCRVMRLPGFYHRKNSPYRSRIIQRSNLEPYGKEYFLRSFNIEISPISIREYQQIPMNRDKVILDALERNNLVVKRENHPENCWTIICPWKHLHSTHDLGTKYFEPSPANPRGGFKCFHDHCKGRSVKDLISFLEIEQPAIAEPLPLHRSLSLPEPFPIDALGNILGRAANVLHNIIRAPDAICAQSILGAAAIACQPFANIEMDGRIIPLSLFLLTIAESGDRKTATDNACLRPIYDWQKCLQGIYKNDMATYRKDLEYWEALKKEWLREAGKGDKPNFDKTEPIAPLHPIILIDEPTYQGLVKYLGVGQPGVGLFSDEGGRFFGGHSMNRDNQIQTIAGLSSLWDGKPIVWVRASEGDMILYGRRVSLHLMIQESLFADIMNNPYTENQGFLPRCLISFPATTAGHRPYIEEDFSSHPDFCRYKDRLNVLLDTRLPVMPPPELQNELHPRKIGLSMTAKKVWIAFHDLVDRDICPGRPFEHIKRFACKAGEHVLRIAGILAIFECPDVTVIEVEYISRAIKLMNYYLSELLRIQGYLMIDPSLALAQKTLLHFRNREKELVTLKEVYQYGPLAIRNSKRAREIMLILQQHGWAEPCFGIEIGGVKHKEAWRIRLQNFLI